jgi:hypothetical protein
MGGYLTSTRERPKIYIYMMLGPTQMSFLTFQGVFSLLLGADVKRLLSVGKALVDPRRRAAAQRGYH